MWIFWIAAAAVALTLGVPLLHRGIDTYDRWRDPPPPPEPDPARMPYDDYDPIGGPALVGEVVDDTPTIVVIPDPLTCDLRMVGALEAPQLFQAVWHIGKWRQSSPPSGPVERPVSGRGTTPGAI